MNQSHSINVVNYFGMVLLTIMFGTAYPFNQKGGGRFTIVAAVKHKQFGPLYEYLKTHAKNFDPRYAGPLRTDGNPHDEHKNLHITLASTDLGARNEKACKEALQAISGLLKNEIHINFNPKTLHIDKEKHVLLSLKKDTGYDQLVKLQQAVVNSLKKQGATGVHAKDPNHVTIGFASKLPEKSFSQTIGLAKVTHARVYHWKGSGDQKYPPREEFYPKKEVQIYKSK